MNSELKTGKEDLAHSVVKKQLRRENEKYLSLREKTKSDEECQLDRSHNWRFLAGIGNKNGDSHI